MFTPAEIKALLYLVTVLLGVLGFVGVLAVNALIRMSRDLSEIKTWMKVGEVKHKNHEERITSLEKLVPAKK